MVFAQRPRRAGYRIENVLAAARERLMAGRQAPAGGGNPHKGLPHQRRIQPSAAGKAVAARSAGAGAGSALRYPQRSSPIDPAKRLQDFESSTSPTTAPYGTPSRALRVVKPPHVAVARYAKKSDLSRQENMNPPD